MLEARGEIAPEAGASILLHPNGFRVLDLIGLYEQITKFAVLADTTINRTEDGYALFLH